MSLIAILYCFFRYNRHFINSQTHKARVGVLKMLSMNYWGHFFSEAKAVSYNIHISVNVGCLIFRGIPMLCDHLVFEQFNH